MIVRFQAWRAERQRRRSIRVIRETCAWFGHPLDDLTDEDIEAGVARLGKAASQMGISADEATQAFAAAYAEAMAAREVFLQRLDLTIAAAAEELHDTLDLGPEVEVVWGDRSGDSRRDRVSDGMSTDPDASVAHE